MTKRLKAPAVILAALLLVATTFSGCGSAGTTPATSAPAATSAPVATSAPATTSADTQSVVPSEPAASVSPVTFTFFVNASWYKWPDWGKDEVSALIQQKTGVTLKFISPNADDNQQMNLMIASGDMPDYLFNGIGSNPTFKKSIAAGLFEDLTPLMDQYAPEMKSYLGDDFWKLNQSSDGKNYYFANAEMRPSNLDKYLTVGPWNPAQLVREDIYKELGSPKIDTPDDLFNVLKSVSEKYPDVTPMLIQASSVASSFRFNSQPYGYQLLIANYGVEKYYDKDGKLFANYRDPNYLTAIKWLNKLYNANLIKRSDMAMTQDQFKAIRDGGKCFYMCDGVNTGYYKPTGNPNVKYVYAPMFADAKILQQDSLAWGGWFISKKCVDKERAIKFMSYMVSDEGEKLSTWGVEGKNWKMIDGNPDWTPEELAAVKSDPEHGNKTGIGKYWFNLDLYDHWILGTSMKNNPEQKEALDLYVPHGDLKMYLLVPPPDSDKEEAIIQTKILTEYSTAFPTFIMAKDEAEVTALYNAFVAKADQMGMPKLETYWSAAAESMRTVFK